MSGHRELHRGVGIVWRVRVFDHGFGDGRQHPRLFASESFREVGQFPTHSVGNGRLVSMKYRCVATSLTGFVQQIATAYLPYGYWFYVTGTVPLGKDPAAVDAKLLERYGIALSRSARVRRKQAGLANLHYLRFDRFFVLLATHGRHHFFAAEANNLRDIRKSPLVIGGYSIAYKRGNYRRMQPGQTVPEPDHKWHSRVRIAREPFRDLKARLLEGALSWPAERLARELYNVPFEPYAPVRQQLRTLLRAINRRRATAGLPTLSPDIIRWRRRIVRPFD